LEAASDRRRPSRLRDRPWFTVAVLWSPPPSTRALVFDCDGTLADTMPIHYVAWRAMLAEHGLVLTEEQFYAQAGMASVASIVSLAAEQGVPLADGQAITMAADKERRYLASLDEVRPIASVVAIAQRHRGTMPMAVASGAERYVLEHTLRTIDVLHWMDAIVAADDTERHKPHPDPFLEAARRLGVEPEACTVFEDADLGIEAARSAGMHVVDVRPWLR
jgi:HAD superfamily hydrolase (TIGR01509 family)